MVSNGGKSSVSRHGCQRKHPGLSATEGRARSFTVSVVREEGAADMVPLVQKAPSQAN